MKSDLAQWRAQYRLSFIIWLLAAASPISAQTAQNSPSTLKFVIIMSRHGVRSPTGNPEKLNQYSAQPWPEWNVPPGHLTPQGASLMTIFGAYYRSSLPTRGCSTPADVLTPHTSPSIPTQINAP